VGKNSYNIERKLLGKAGGNVKKMKIKFENLKMREFEN
jgi:hypothetical protein